MACHRLCCRETGLLYHIVTHLVLRVSDLLFPKKCYVDGLGQALIEMKNLLSSPSFLAAPYIEAFPGTPLWNLV